MAEEQENNEENGNEGNALSPEKVHEYLNRYRFANLAVQKYQEAPQQSSSKDQEQERQQKMQEAASALEAMVEEWDLSGEDKEDVQHAITSSADDPRQFEQAVSPYFEKYQNAKNQLTANKFYEQYKNFLAAESDETTEKIRKRFESFGDKTIEEINNEYQEAQNTLKAHEDSKTQFQLSEDKKKKYENILNEYQPLIGHMEKAESHYMGSLDSYINDRSYPKQHEAIEQREEEKKKKQNGGNGE